LALQPVCFENGYAIAPDRPAAMSVLLAAFEGRCPSVLWPSPDGYKISLRLGLLPEI